MTYRNSLLTMNDIAAFLKTLPNTPGIYCYHNAKGEVIYVGKAKNLKKRISSYFNREHQDPKTRTLVKNIADIQITLTHTEREALLLENNLIKQHRPRYNVLFRDDKSYPYLYIPKEPFPRLVAYRGNRQQPGQFFGPYPSMYAVKQTLSTLQKIFKVRQCEPHVFAHRTRPCLQYQIQRCCAPCVGYINQADYAEIIEHIRLFLCGKNQQVLDMIGAKMEAASEQLAFETAARYRDQLRQLQQLQESQTVIGKVSEQVDVVAVAQHSGQFCAQVLMVRDGQVLGTKLFYPKSGLNEDKTTILLAFMAQYYTVGMGARSLPKTIVAQCDTPEALQDYLSEQAGHKVQWVRQPRGKRLQWLQLCQHNAEAALVSHLAHKQTRFNRIVALQEHLMLPEPPKRIECFDISHSQGEATTASCVVFDQQGPVKSAYRRFNIQCITQGDDYAAMKEALTRRYVRLQDEQQSLPEVVLIDGGKGQLSQAISVIQALDLKEITLIGVAKGPSRKPGMELLWLPGESQPRRFKQHDPALLLIQEIRDEAHRFAITGHRGRRDKKRKTSEVQNIPGIGAKRRQALLRHFGGWQQLREAAVEEIAKVPGISLKLAQDIASSFTRH